MPRWLSSAPRKKLPPPTTIAISTVSTAAAILSGTFDEHIRRALHEQRLVTLEYEFRWTTGESHWYEGRVVPVGPDEVVRPDEVNPSNAREMARRLNEELDCDLDAEHSQP